MEEVHQAGKLRSIRVSNFVPSDLDNIHPHGSLAPQVNRVLVHAGNTPTDLIDHCQRKDFLVEVYSPSLRPPQQRAGRRDRCEVRSDGPQLCIRWTVQLGAVSLPKTANPEHMRSNTQLDFEISDDDMRALRDLDERGHGKSSMFPVYSGKSQRASTWRTQ